MRSWQLPFLGLRQFPLALTGFEIQYFFGFSPEQVAQIKTRRGQLHRVAAAIHMGFIRLTGRSLDAFDRIPEPVLSYVGEQLGIAAPELSTLRALYGRRRTLFEHQTWAAHVLGFRPYNERRQRVLITHLRREADKAPTIRALRQSAQRWLYDRQILLPSGNRLNRVVGRVQREADRDALKQIQDVIPETVRREWLIAVMAKRTTGETTLEWLKKPPAARSHKTLATALEKLTWLREQGVEGYNLDSIRLSRQRQYAQRVRARSPARWRSTSEPRRCVELACFLRITLMQITDTIVSLIDMKILDIQRAAVRRVREEVASIVPDARLLLRRIRRLLEDDTVADADLREQLLELVPTEAVLSQSRAARVRYLLSEPACPVRSLLKRFLVLPFQSHHAGLLKAIEYLRAAYVLRHRTLPDEIDIGFAPPWRELLQGRDRRRALRAFEAATVLELRKALKNGSVWIPISLAYRQRDQILISTSAWNDQRGRYYEQLSIPPQPHDLVQRLLGNVEVGLNVIAKEVEAGRIHLDANGLHARAIEAEEEPSAVKQTRRALFREIGEIQFPDLIVEVDTHTRFSWCLLGQEPTSAREILSLYGAILSHGTALDPSEVALMIAEVSAEDITHTMRVLEDHHVLRQTNERVVEFMLRHPIVGYWGDGNVASSDSLSLDATRHLWNARLDPRRRARAVGTYTHVLDRWGIIYDQPVLLGHRQAGPAIEGAVRQIHADDLEYLAVDTHGYTDFALAVAKLLGFDLCPRLKNLRERRFHVPSSINVPTVLSAVTVHDVSLNQLEHGWDELVRVVASIDSGTTSATLALQRFGAASRADPIHKAGTALGKILLTLFLCDIFTNPTFRRLLQRNLAHGESVHALQRLIYNGGISALHGRRFEELFAISGSLSLLTNMVMAWNTHHMQRVWDNWIISGHAATASDVIRHIAPVHSGGINFRGEFHFPIEQYRERLMPSRNAV